MKKLKTLLPLLLILCFTLLFVACDMGGRAVEKISVDTTGVKVTYNAGETVDFTGLKVILHYNDNTTETIGLSDVVTIDPVSTDKAGQVTVTVRYDKFAATFPITVKEVPTVTSLELDTTGVTKSYIVGDEASLAGLVIRANLSDGTSVAVSLDSADLSVSGLSTATAGKKTVTVSYKGAEATFTIDVREPKTQTGIRVDASGVKTDYSPDEIVDFSGLRVYATYNWGEETVINVADCTIAGADTATSGTKTVTVTYHGFSATFTINVAKGDILGISVSTDGVKLVWEKGETVDLSGIVVTLRQKGVADRALSADEYTVSDYSSVTETGTHTVTVTLVADSDFTDTFTFVIRTVSGIDVDASHVKTSGIYVGDKPDYSALVITVTRTDGTTFTVPASECTITGDDVSAPGTVTVTVSYRGFTDTFTVTFVAAPVAIDVFSLPSFVTAFRAITGVTAGEGSYKRAITYRVGSANGFVFKPIASVFDDDDKLVSVERFETSFKLFEDGAEITGDALAAVVSYDPATYTYQFTAAAVGHTYTLEVSPKNYTTVSEINPVSFTFNVVDAWNVYTTADLSRVANPTGSETFGPNSAINEKNAWDAWKLANGVTKLVDGATVADDTKINGVVLHSSFNLTTADFPTEYFVTAAEDASGEAVGHLKDWIYAYRRYIDEGDTFSMYGNGFSINLAALPTIYDSANHQWGYGSDYSNSCVFKFEGKNTDKTYSGGASVNMQDLSIVGNAMRTNDVDKLIPDLGGMICVKYSNVNATVGNLIVTRSFIGLFTDYNTKAVFSDTRVYDSLQDAMFIWGGGHITVKTSEMKRAGGPLVIAQHNDPKKSDAESRIPELYFDTETVLENRVNGQEAWFANNGTSGFAAQIIGLDASLKSAADAYNNALNANSLSAFAFNRKSICNADNYIDLLVLMMSDGVGVTGATGAQGLTKVGDTVVGTLMEDSTITAFRTRLAAVIGADAAAQVIILQNSNGDLMWTDGSNFYVDYNGNPATTLNDFVTAELTACATSGGATAPNRSFFTEGDYLTIYASGMGIVASYK